ncbi:mannitol dehydrogenase [Cryptomeria japonica]|uniref:mannitol dehydrogenase n=1 Tax=Cryptomeria japonica TaxID=3369 RepID=UPI0027DA333D|nr:mannitol dehydrogenase [Cryptomeria japonica]
MHRHCFSVDGCVVTFNSQKLCVIYCTSIKPLFFLKMAEKGFDVQGWAARDQSGVLSPFNFTRRKTGPNDVTFKVAFCGICHSDLHQLRNDWHNTQYPIVPGHEIVGTVTEVGTQVKKFSVGDRVGVGCLVGSCHSCDSCEKGLEQYCDKIVFTYNSMDVDGSITYGGYSSLMVCDQKFIIKVPESLPFDAAAPLLCAGITVYSPMKYFRMTEKGNRLGVVGLGGLGHMAVKLGKAFGLHVTVISTSPNKEKEAKEVLGADDFLISKDANQMRDAAKSLDYIIDTVSADHPLPPLLNLLKVNGKLVVVGIPSKPLQFPATSVIFGRRLVAGSSIGGIEETQEMMDFCADHNISCTIEKISIDYVNTAIERLEKGDVKYRFVIDNSESSKV